MIKHCDVVFDVRSFWHAGTGRGSGPELDAMVARSPAGLPILPGRTVKGLLRHICQVAVDGGFGDPATLRWAFGHSPDPASTEAEIAQEAIRRTTEPGHVRFGSAVLGGRMEGAKWEAWARSASGAAAARELFRSFATTAIDEAGLAREHTLRVVELTVPCRLVARVEAIGEPTAGDPDWVGLLRAAVPVLRAIGSSRTRGLGRVQVSVEAAS